VEAEKMFIELGRGVKLRISVELANRNKEG
jgi:hypothetical protein